MARQPRPIPEELLRQAVLFRALDGRAVQQAQSLFYREEYQKNDLIFCQGQSGDCLYIIAEGRVRIYSNSIDGRESTLRVFEPGDTFGEFSVLDGGLRSTAAIALESLVTFALHRDDFWSLADRNPLLSRHIIGLLTERLRYTTQYWEDLAFLDVSQRIAMIILQYTKPDEAHAPSKPLRMSQQDLATCANTTREWLNKALKQFEQEGLIEIGYMSVNVLNRAGLQQKVIPSTESRT